MKRIYYPDCSGRSCCPVWRDGGRYCRRCRFTAPLGLLSVSCPDLNRELFNRR